MNKQEFKRVWAVASNKQPSTLTQEEKTQTDIALSGIGIFSDKSRRLSTVAMCAYFLNYHALMFNGSYDMQAVEDMAFFYRKVDLLD